MKNQAARAPRRKIYYVSPRTQGAAALLFAAIVAAGGLVFGVSAFLYLNRALRAASLQAHYIMATPFDVVRNGVVWHVVALFAGVSMAGTAAFLCFVRAAEHGLGRVIVTLRGSAGGDLSTPTHPAGLPEIRRLAGQVDDIRAFTLAQIREIRAESLSLAEGDAQGDDFRRRWGVLKQKIRKVAP